MSNLLPELPNLPVDMMLDKYHPDNTQFYKTNRQLERLIVMQSKLCRQRHINIAKLHLKGERNVDIAARLNISPMTVSTILKRSEVQELINLLRYKNSHHDSVTIAHRKNILYQIIVDNQETDPRVAITCIQEMNKMDGVGKEDLNKQPSQVTIVINQDQMPKTVLDA